MPFDVHLIFLYYPFMSFTKNKGFTLIELLVVVAAVGILLSILVPAITKGVKLAQRAQASAGMRSIAMAWQQYAYDNDGRIMSSDNGPRRGQDPWVTVPQGTTRQDREDAIEAGAIFPYVQNFDIFTDPNHVFPTYVNSYGMNGALNSSWGQPSLPRARFRTRAEHPEGRAASHIGQANPGTVLLFAEYDARNYNNGSYVMHPLVCNWVDRVAGNYWGGDNLAFVDGHVEFRHWEDPDTLRSLASHGLSDPGSLDCKYLESVFYPLAAP